MKIARGISGQRPSTMRTQTRLLGRPLHCQELPCSLPSHNTSSHTLLDQTQDHTEARTERLWMRHHPMLLSSRPRRFRME